MPAAARREARARTAYRVLRTTQVDEYDAAVSLEAVVAAVRRRPGENFRGTARRVAKLSIADAAFEAFDDLQDLITSVPNEEAMTAHEPPLGWPAHRIAWWRSGGTCESALSCMPPAARMTMTSTSSWGAPHPATGLHDDGGVRPAPADHRHRATLQQARDDYKAFFQDHPLGLPGASYDFYDRFRWKSKGRCSST